MGEEEKNPNQIYLCPDLVEEIFLRLPLKSIIKFKTVSKHWRSILESRKFTERRLKIQKKPKILAAGVGDGVGDRTGSRFEGDAEIDMVYLHCDEATRTSLTCDGLVCIPVPDWVNVLNPSTGEFLRFPSGPDPVNMRYNRMITRDHWWYTFPGYWVMGFGKDKVNGDYKVVRMPPRPKPYCEILDVKIGEWRKLATMPPHRVDAIRKSACVNGSIYWLELVFSYSILALDLYTEEFRSVSLPSTASSRSDQIVNLEDRVALVKPDRSYWKLEILILDAKEESWSMIYSINLLSFAYPVPYDKVLFMPLALSKKGNLFLSDSNKRLFKYYPEANLVRCISQDVCVISPFTENLVMLRPSSVPETSGYRSGLHYLEHKLSPQVSKKLRRNEMKIPNILLTTALVSLMTTAIAIEDVRRELKILRALTGHKNLVQFYDTFEDDENVYIVMELCKGELLDKILQRGGKYSEEDAKKVMVQILSVVAYCLLQGVVHRDLKGHTREPNFEEAPWPEAVDFVKRLLNKDYCKSLTAAQALCNPWLAGSHELKIPSDMIIYKLVKLYIMSSSLRKSALSAVPQIPREQFNLLGPSKTGYISMQNYKTAILKSSTEATKDSRVLDFVHMISCLQFKKLDFEEFCASALSVYQLEAMETWEQHARRAYELETESS